METFRIRYNTNSTNDKNCWRIIREDNSEVLADSVDIQVPTFTTKDWIEEIGAYKYHLSCTGNLVFSLDNKAIIINK